jgi:hypothetical protein
MDLAADTAEPHAREPLTLREGASHEAPSADLCMPAAGMVLQPAEWSGPGSSGQPASAPGQSRPQGHGHGQLGIQRPVQGPVRGGRSGPRRRQQGGREQGLVRPGQHAPQRSGIDDGLAAAGDGGRNRLLRPHRVVLRGMLEGLRGPPGRRGTAGRQGRVADGPRAAADQAGRAHSADAADPQVHQFVRRVQPRRLRDPGLCQPSWSRRSKNRPSWRWL